MADYPYFLDKRQGKKKYSCPQCLHPKCFTLYVDAAGQALAPDVGICDRQNNCGYHYHWADYFKAHPGDAPKRSLSAPAPAKIEPRPIEIPGEVFRASLKGHEQNHFCQFLQRLFGAPKALELARRFHLGTSNAIWKGAAVFWLIDRKGRAYAGQLIDFDPATGHTVKETAPDGSKKRRNNWAHWAISAQYRKEGKPAPAWLNLYNKEAARFPFAFGLHQLSAPNDRRPVAVVEAAKTAVGMSGFYPAAVWLAIGSLSYLNAERLAYVKDRQIILYPDLGAFDKWSAKAQGLSAAGFDVAVSDLLERSAAETDRAAGFDIADYFIAQALSAEPDDPTPAPMPATSDQEAPVTSPPACLPGLPAGFQIVGQAIEVDGLPLAWLSDEEHARALKRMKGRELEILKEMAPPVRALVELFGLELEPESYAA